MRTYKYILFLRHPVNLDCINQEIDVDTDEDQEYLDIHSLTEKLHRNGTRVFKGGYTLVGMNIHSVSKQANTVDWSQAPEGTQAYACNEDGTCYWYIGGGAQLFKDFGKFLCESWVSRELAPDFNLDCEWHESLVYKPTT